RYPRFAEGPNGRLGCERVDSLQRRDGDTLPSRANARRDGGVGGHVGSVRHLAIRPRLPATGDISPATFAGRALRLLADPELRVVFGRAGQSAAQPVRYLVLGIGATLGTGTHRALSVH